MKFEIIILALFLLIICQLSGQWRSCGYEKNCNEIVRNDGLGHVIL